MRKRMLVFWDEWRKAGKPPLPWRESLRTAKPRAPAATPAPPRRKPGPTIVLTEEDKAFARKVGMKLPPDL
jgi:hypothetical protein